MCGCYLTNCSCNSINIIQQNGDRQVLTAMGLCFNKSFQVIDCTGNKMEKCTPDYPIMYPTGEDPGCK